MKKIFVINGRAGSGKDTFVNFCSWYAKVENYSSVQPIKEIAASVGWDRAKKSEKDRKFLSDLKQLLARYNDFPFEAIKRKIQDFSDSNKEILFIHIREPEEIARVKELQEEVGIPIVTLFLDNPRTELITSNESDANVANYTYDVTIRNDGTKDDLERKAENFITKQLVIVPSGFAKDGVFIVPSRPVLAE